MIYPSLLYKSEPGNQTVAANVFDDLKLNLLLSPKTIEAMSMLCVDSDIPLRQAAYRDVAANLSDFEALLALARKAESLHQFYNDSESEPERDFVFVMLTDAAVKFTNLAVSVRGESDLITRFREAFGAEREDVKFKYLENQLNEQIPRATAVSTVKFTVRGDQLKLNRYGGGSTLIERVYKCAADLELNVTEEFSNPDFRLNSRIYSALASLFPDEFGAFRNFYRRFNEHFDDALLKYALELNLYVEAAGLFDKARQSGLPVCMPEISGDVRYSAQNLCDMSLLLKETEAEIVPNDVIFTAGEPFFFLTGANGGGKTTYLRSIGIAALFARSGLPVAANSAEIYPFNSVYTHFPRDEQGESRLAEEERRVGEIPQSGGSLILLNETYSTTTYEKSAALTSALADSLAASGSLTLYITHQLSAVNSKLPVLTAVVDSSGDNRRTFKIVRAEGVTSSFAKDILKKYGLNKEALQ